MCVGSFIVRLVLKFPLDFVFIYLLGSRDSTFYTSTLSIKKYPVSLFIAGVTLLVWIVWKRVDLLLFRL